MATVLSLGVRVAAGSPAPWVQVEQCSACAGLGSIPEFDEVDLGASFVRVLVGEQNCPVCQGSGFELGGALCGVTSSALLL